MSSDVWDSIPVGTIVDADLTRLARAGLLITNDFAEQSVKQACYELRASDTFYNVSEAEENRRVKVSAGEPYLLKPHCYVVVICRESLRLPADVLGRVLTKGQLFSLGILPVNTYADPGFTGRLGITLFNASNRYLKIEPGQPIAKIEFSRLPKPVERPYHGQHGYETQVWPVAFQHIADTNAPELARHICSKESELTISYGPLIGALASDVRHYTKVAWIQLSAFLLCFGLALTFWGGISVIGTVVLGVLSNILTHLGFAAVTRIQRRRA